jgi:hypothetical protein
MWDWLERQKERDRELQAGVDADLVRDNNKRWKWSAIIAGCGLLILGFLAYAKLPVPWSKIVAAMAGILTIGGLILGRFALLWDRFIRRADPKGPPSLFK